MATAVTNILKQILTAQLRRTIDGQEAVRRILEAVKKQVIADIASVSADSFTAFQQQRILADIDRLLIDAGGTINRDLSRGIADSWEEGLEMLPEMANAVNLRLNSAVGISSHLMEQIQQFAWGKISGLAADTQSKIRAELAMGILGQKTPQEIAGSIAGSLEKPSIFKTISERAEVITKTELGRAFSMAHQASLNSALDTLPELEKMWLHAGHPKSPRIPHLNLNGNTTPVETPFLVGNIAMMYPRDPKAPVSEIINCGCVHVAWMPVFGTKKEFAKAWGDAQKAAKKAGDHKDAPQ